ncbi:MAG: hypothetical protein ACRC8K_16475 [Waterburya sp.]
MAVEKSDLALPITNWTSEIGNFLQKAYDNLPKSGLFIISGRGKQLDDILSIRERCSLEDLNFLDLECAVLQGIELIFAIRSLTIILDELLSAVDELSCISWQAKNDKEKMLIAFEQATIHQNLNWDNEDEQGLFSFIKALIFVIANALANNQVFLYINYQC